MNKILLLIVVILAIISQSCIAEIDSAVANTPFGMQALRYEFIIALLTFLGGWGFIVAGFIFTILGFTGNIEWMVEAVGFTSRLTNASPGIILMVIGLIMVLKSRFKIKNK